MGNVGKSLALALVLVMAISSASLLTVKPANGQTLPSIPKFTVNYNDNSFVVPPTWATDQYTGKTVKETEGYYEQNKSITLTIPNLPFDPQGNENLTLFYQVAWKGHFGAYWSDTNVSSSNSVYDVSNGKRYLDNPNAVFTEYSLGFSGNNGTSRYGYYNFIDDISPGGQIDFRIRSLQGYFTKVYEYDKYVPGMPVDDPTDPIPHYYVFNGQTSDWSPTQTITIGQSSSVPEFPAIAILPLVLSLPLVGAMLRKRKVNLD